MGFSLFSYTEVSGFSARLMVPVHWEHLRLFWMLMRQPTHCVTCKSACPPPIPHPPNVHVPTLLRRFLVSQSALISLQIWHVSYYLLCVFCKLPKHCEGRGWLGWGWGGGASLLSADVKARGWQWEAIQRLSEAVRSQTLLLSNSR